MWIFKSLFPASTPTRSAYDTPPVELMVRNPIRQHISVTFTSIDELFNEIRVVPDQKKSIVTLYLNNNLDKFSIAFLTSNAIILNVNSLSHDSAEALAQRSDINTVDFNGTDSRAIRYLLKRNKSIKRVSLAVPLQMLNDIGHIQSISLTLKSLPRIKNYPYFYRYRGLSYLSIESGINSYRRIRVLMKTMKYCRTLKGLSFNRTQSNLYNRFYFRGETKRVIYHEVPNFFKLYHFDLNNVAFDVVYPQLLPHRARSIMFISRVGHKNIFSRMGKLKSNTYVVENVFLMSEIRVLPQ